MRSGGIQKPLQPVLELERPAALAGLPARIFIEVGEGAVVDALGEARGVVGILDDERRPGRPVIADHCIEQLQLGFAEESAEWGAVYSGVMTDCNEAIRPVDDRMPVLLMPDEYDAWLNGDFDQAIAFQNRSFPDDLIEVERTASRR